MIATLCYYETAIITEERIYRLVERCGVYYHSPDMITIILLTTLLLATTSQARTVNIEAAVACRPDLLPLLPARINDICSRLQPNYYFNSGQC